MQQGEECLGIGRLVGAQAEAGSEERGAGQHDIEIRQKPDVGRSVLKNKKGHSEMQKWPF
jgi:hypothetical protein